MRFFYLHWTLPGNHQKDLNVNFKKCTKKYRLTYSPADDKWFLNFCATLSFFLKAFFFHFLYICIYFIFLPLINDFKCPHKELQCSLNIFLENWLFWEFENYWNILNFFLLTLENKDGKYLNTVATDELLCLKNAGTQISMFFISNE